MKIIANTDASLIAKLNEPVHRLHYDIAPDLFKPYNYEEFQIWFKEQINKDNVYTFVAYNDEEIPVGFIMAYIIEEQEDVFQYARKKFHIEQVSVLDPYQSQGYGSALIKKIEEIAHEKGIREVEINYWSTNIRGKYFYKCNGYDIYRETVKKRVI